MAASGEHADITYEKVTIPVESFGVCTYFHEKPYKSFKPCPSKGLELILGNGLCYDCWDQATVSRSDQWH